MARHRNKESACPNCGHALSPEFEFCPGCGQENHDLRVPFRTFLYEFVENITHFDTKLWSTLRAIITRPGRLTKDFVEGRRARYVHPARFYIFTSVIFFALLGMQMGRNMRATDARLNSPKDVADPGLQRRAWLADAVRDTTLERWTQPTWIDVPIDRPFYRQARERLHFPGPAVLDSLLRTGRTEDTLHGTRNAVRALLFQLPDADSLDVEFHRNINGILTSFTERRDDHFLTKGRMTDADLDSLLGADRDSLSWVKRRALLSLGRLDMTSDEGRARFSGAVLKAMSIVMFVLMPFTGVLLLWTFDRRRFYWEHLIFSVHAHTTFFLFAIVLLAFTLITGAHWPPWALAALAVGWGVYLLICLRTVYGHPWGATLGRAALMGIPYLIIFLALVIAGVLWGFFTI